MAVEILQGSQNETAYFDGDFRSSQMYGPYLLGSSLYVPTSSFVGALVSMNKSTDGGLTWTTFPGAVVQGNFSAYLRGTTIVVAYIDYTAGSPQGLDVQEFDTLTDTWGVPVHFDFTPFFPIPGDAILQLDGFAGRTADGLILLTVTEGTNFIYFALSYNAGVFGVPVNLTTNFFAPALVAVVTSLIHYIVDSLDRTHIFMCQTSAAFGDQYYYQAIDSTNVLGSFTAFADSANFLDYGTPAIVSGQLVLPVNDSGLGSIVKVAGPLAAPAWGVGGTSIDAHATTSPHAGTAILIGSKLYVLIVTDDSGGTMESGIVLAQTSNLVNPTLGWTSAYLLDGVSGLVNNYMAAIFGVNFDGSISLLFDAVDNVIFTPTAFFVSAIISGGASVRQWIIAQHLPVFHLPQGMMLNSAGVNDACFPIKPKGCQ